MPPPSYVPARKKDFPRAINHAREVLSRAGTVGEPAGCRLNQSPRARIEPMPALHVVQHGQGRPLLALHGFGPDHRMMTGLLEPLFAARPGYRRIYPDLPGFGRSPVGEVTSTAEMVAVLEALIDEQIGDEPFLLAGESYGGYLAAELTRRRPHQVKGLALICPLVVPAFGQRDVPVHQVLVRDPATTADLELAERVQFETIAVVQTPETLARFTAEIASGLELHDAAAATRLQATGYALPASPYEGEPFTQPVLIITGRQDAVVGFAVQWRVSEWWPRACFAVLDAAGHSAHLERPALTAALLEDWLERLPNWSFDKG